ncbi:hypothetical protein EC844_107131 [Acinetobacter calcoaceticus]|uniref:Major type 1 subunit fimbrin (Pilin) n=1 Tax=Acinetobacter calcoaceticus TaxID=471 RepID=A0A4R1XV25_ACICA|nr:hypothetical protein EC844_107131 [Acinetobacter calcoaceticus]
MPVFAETGKITFVGRIVAADTCVANIHGATQRQSPSHTALILASTPKDSLVKFGAKEAENANFSIGLSNILGQKCRGAKTIAGVYFSSDEGNIDTHGRLKNRGDAKNVDLQLLNDKKMPINLSLGYGRQASSTLMNQAYHYQIKYFAAEEAQQDGTVNDVTFTIVYK